MKTRNHDWLDTINLKPLLCIDVWDENRWCNYAENGRLYVAKSEEERQQKRKELRKIKVE